MTDTPRVLVLGETTFPFHDIDEVGPRFLAVLTDADVTVSGDRASLLELSEYDVLVDYLTDSTLTDEQTAALQSFVADGGGYVGVHCAADLTSRAPDDPDELIASREEPVPELREIVGGHFLNHPEQAEFGVEVVADHPITDGVDDFRVFDEPYQVTADDDVAVLARMAHPDLEEYPVVWTNPAAGRVAYVSLGHTEDAFETEGFRRLLRNAVAWAAEA
ncbi:MAG: ThuA domain-containing protein [Haloarculaceae archaeon]